MQTSWLSMQCRDLSHWVDSRRRSVSMHRHGDKHTNIYNAKLLTKQVQSYMLSSGNPVDTTWLSNAWLFTQADSDSAQLRMLSIVPPLILQSNLVPRTWELGWECDWWHTLTARAWTINEPYLPKNSRPRCYVKSWTLVLQACFPPLFTCELIQDSLWPGKRSHS